MEARWMDLSFWLNIYHSWYLPWRQKQALFLTRKRDLEKATGTVSTNSSKYTSPTTKISWLEPEVKTLQANLYNSTWWFVVQSVTSMDTAVFCGICDNYGHLWWYSWVAVHFEFVSGDFHTISWFFSKIWMFWTEYDILVWGEADFMIVSIISVWICILAWSFFLFLCIWQPWKVPCQICRWTNLQVRRCRAKSAGKKFKVRRCHRNFASKRFFKVRLVTIHRLGADLDYNVIVEHVFVMTSWFSTPLPG